MKTIKWSIIVGGFLLCFLVLSVVVLKGNTLLGFSPEIPFLADTGIGYDPLTVDEADRALALALGINGKTTEKTTVKTAAKAAHVAASQPLEMLLVERYDAPKGSANDARQGEVYLYDYATDTLIHSMVDVTTGAVTTERLQGVQLPLTTREEDRAVDLITNDTTLWQTLSARYETITGDPLNDMNQLQVKVSLFLADAMPDQVNPAAQQCGQHRCAQVLLFTVDRTVLEILPIVDLSKGQVIQLMSDSWTGAS